jgi:transcriptional regulator with XRE-family HTH domain
MWRDQIREWFNRDTMPNRLSIAIGERIKDAREERGLSQTQLAEAIFKRRPSISEMENGRMYPDIQSLLLMSRYLKKPLSYFIPSFIRVFKDEDALTPEEEELLLYFRRIRQHDQQRLAINQMRVLSEFEPSIDDDDED